MNNRLPPLVLVIAVSGLAFAALPAIAQTDLYGDPLPAGALARFGTLRFRADTGSSLRFLPDGTTLALGSLDTISLMDMERGTVRKLRLCEERVRTLTFSPGGRFLAAHIVDRNATGNTGNKICVWDAPTGKLLHTIPLADPKNLPRVLAIARDGKMLALGGDNPVIRLLDTATGTERWQVASHIPWRGVSNRCLAFSPDGTLLVGPSEKDSSLCLWGVATGQKRHELCNCASAYCAVFSGDGKTLAATAEIRAQEKLARLHLWDVVTGRELPLPEQQAGAVYEAAFSPDGTLVAASAASNIQQVYWGPLDIGLWNVATGKKLRQWRGGWNLAFSPDGATLLSSYGAPVFMHEVTTGRELKQEFFGHQSALWSVAFAPDGKTLITEDRYQIRNT
jgi:WD40 repeat protein